MNTPAHERDEFGRDARVYPSSRRDRSMSSHRRDISRRPSPTNSRSRRSRMPREKRPPRRSRGDDFLAHPNNPNAIVVGTRGVKSTEDTAPLTSNRTRVPPPLFTPVPVHKDALPRRDDLLMDIDVLPATAAGPFDPRDNETDVLDTRSSRQTNGHVSARPLPLTDLPPNVHPSRRAAMSQDLLTEGGGARQSANTGAPRKQIGDVAQSIEPSEKIVPTFMSHGSNANAMPLGPGKRMRF